MPITEESVILEELQKLSEEAKNSGAKFADFLKRIADIKKQKPDCYQFLLSNSDKFELSEKLRSRIYFVVYKWFWESDFLNVSTDDPIRNVKFIDRIERMYKANAYYLQFSDLLMTEADICKIAEDLMNTTTFSSVPMTPFIVTKCNALSTAVIFKIDNTIEPFLSFITTNYSKLTADLQKKFFIHKVYGHWNILMLVAYLQPSLMKQFLTAIETITNSSNKSYVRTLFLQTNPSNWTVLLLAAANFGKSPDALIELLNFISRNTNFSMHHNDDSKLFSFSDFETMLSIRTADGNNVLHLAARYNPAAIIPLIDKYLQYHRIHQDIHVPTAERLSPMELYRKVLTGLFKQKNTDGEMVLSLIIRYQPQVIRECLVLFTDDNNNNSFCLDVLLNLLIEPDKSGINALMRLACNNPEEFSNVLDTINTNLSTIHDDTKLAHCAQSIRELLTVQTIEENPQNLLMMTVKGNSMATKNLLAFIERHLPSLLLTKHEVKEMFAATAEGIHALEYAARQNNVVAVSCILGFISRYTDYSSKPSSYDIAVHKPLTPPPSYTDSAEDKSKLLKLFDKEYVAKLLFNTTSVDQQNILTLAIKNFPSFSAKGKERVSSVSLISQAALIQLLNFFEENTNFIPNESDEDKLLDNDRVISLFLGANEESTGKMTHETALQFAIKEKPHAVKYLLPFICNHHGSMSITTLKNIFRGVDCNGQSSRFTLFSQDVTVTRDVRAALVEIIVDRLGEVNNPHNATKEDTFESDMKQIILPLIDLAESVNAKNIFNEKRVAGKLAFIIASKIDLLATADTLNFEHHVNATIKLLVRLNRCLGNKNLFNEPMITDSLHKIIYLKVSALMSNNIELMSGKNILQPLAHLFYCMSDKETFRTQFLNAIECNVDSNNIQSIQRAIDILQTSLISLGRPGDINNTSNAIDGFMSLGDWLAKHRLKLLHLSNTPTHSLKVMLTAISTLQSKLVNLEDGCVSRNTNSTLKLTI